MNIGNYQRNILYVTKSFVKISKINCTNIIKKTLQTKYFLKKCLFRFPMFSETTQVSFAESGLIRSDEIEWKPIIWVKKLINGLYISHKFENEIPRNFCQYLHCIWHTFGNIIYRFQKNYVIHMIRKRKCF